MEVDYAKLLQIMSSMNGGGNKDMSMLMQLLPAMMNGSKEQSRPTQITLNPEEVNKTIFKLYRDEK